MGAAAQVLYIDDDPLQLRAFRRALRNDAYDVSLHTDHADALDRLADTDVEVVVSDWRMPAMDGIEFLEKARRLRPQARRVLVTGEREFGAAVDAVNRVSVHHLVPKPWSDNEMRQVLSGLVEAVRLERDNTRLQRLVAEKHDALERLNQQLEIQVHDRTRNVLDGLVLALDYRDSETQWHSRRVSKYSGHLARELGVRGAQLQDVEWGALLHDVGKIGIPDAILLKPGGLTKEEWQVMRRHPEIGETLLRGIDFLQGAAEIVSHHHERWDGSGYPRGLRGDQICLGARIFAVIDTFDAMTSDRPYRPSVRYDVALAEIRRVDGIQLDPRIVEAFVGVDPLVWQAMREDVGGLDYHELVRSTTGAFPTGGVTK